MVDGCGSGGDGVVMNAIKGNRILLFAFTETARNKHESTGQTRDRNREKKEASKRVWGKKDVIKRTISNSN